MSAFFSCHLHLVGLVSVSLIIQVVFLRITNVCFNSTQGIGERCSIVYFLAVLTDVLNDIQYHDCFLLAVLFSYAKYQCLY